MSQYGQHFTIEPATRPALESLLANRDGTLDAAADRLINVVLTSGCEYLVAEAGYLDADYRACHNQFYYLHHRNTPRRCIRVHFFECKIARHDLFQMMQVIKNAYLGFVVVRPLPAHVCGRAVLRWDLIEKMKLGPLHQRFITCTAKYWVNLAGNSIEIKAVPWMEQDSMVAACASTAIWITNWHMSHRFTDEFKRFTTPQITDLAVRYLMTGRSMPSDGLQVEQMLSALKGMGYEPLLKVPGSGEDPQRFAYHYIESGIPVIAVISSFQDGRPRSDGHALTLVGHTLDHKLEATPYRTFRQKGRNFQIFDSSAFVPSFIVQDDSGGPFRFMEMTPWDKMVGKSIQNTVFTQEIVDDHKQHSLAFLSLDNTFARLEGLIVPLPFRVTLGGIRAQETAVELVRDRLIKTGQLNDTELLFRTFLQPSNLTKDNFGRPEVPVDISIPLRRAPLPHWVWVTEYGSQSSITKRNQIFGHIVQDSSGRGSSSKWDDVLSFVTPTQIFMSDDSNREYIVKDREPVAGYLPQLRAR